MENVMSWKKALDNGCEPSQYPYGVNDVPMGTFEAKLDFKIWAKLPFAIHCYYTEVATGRKFQLTVFKRDEDELYALKGGELDFKVCPTDAVYMVTVSAKEKGYTLFEKAELVE